MLEAGFSARAGSFELQASLQAADSEIVAVVGPNGAGKTTLLRAIAGLHPLAIGAIRVDGRAWEDPARGLRLSPERRSVGLVPQDGLLFPHMTVAENVAFGSADGSASWLEQVGLAHRSESLPSELSGGQRQLVALARALARMPRVLLLDEPLASVDAAQRPEVRRILRDQLQAVRSARLVVTHDAIEAAALGDRVVVLEEGRVSQVGTPQELRVHPRSEYVAALVGVNFFRGVAVGGAIDVEPTGRLIAADPVDGQVLATIHPRAVALHTERPEGSPRNVLECRVTGIEPSLERVRIELLGEVALVAEVTPEGAGALAVGDRVWASIKASEVMVYPR